MLPTPRHMKESSNTSASKKLIWWGPGLEHRVVNWSSVRHEMECVWNLNNWHHWRQLMVTPTGVNFSLGFPIHQDRKPDINRTLLCSLLSFHFPKDSRLWQHHLTQFPKYFLPRISHPLFSSPQTKSPSCLGWSWLWELSFSSTGGRKVGGQLKRHGLMDLYMEETMD